MRPTLAIVLSFLLFEVIPLTSFNGCKREEKTSKTQQEVSPQEIPSQEVSPQEKSPVSKTDKELKTEKWGNAPDFTLPELGGGEFTLSSLKGKVIIIDFWATWCGPCRMEIPGFISLYKKYKGRGLEIVGVSLDKDRETAVGPYAEQMGINYIIVFGDQDVVENYGGIRGIPTTFIIDQNGNIVGKHVGVVSNDVFENEIKKLLGEVLPQEVSPQGAK